jgi:hypothetical protein
MQFIVAITQEVPTPSTSQGSSVPRSEANSSDHGTYLVGMEPGGSSLRREAVVAL